MQLSIESSPRRRRGKLQGNCHQVVHGRCRAGTQRGENITLLITASSIIAFWFGCLETRGPRTETKVDEPCPPCLGQSRGPQRKD